MDHLFNADIAARGVWLGVSQSFFLPLLVYVTDQIELPWHLSHLRVLTFYSVAITLLLLWRPLVLLTLHRKKINPFIGPEGVQAQLHGRLAGLLVGLPAGAFLVYQRLW